MSDVLRLIGFFENFAAADLPRLGDYYAQEATFVDPFNSVRGLPAIQHIYREMFETTVAPRFTIRRHMAQGGECWLVWDFHFEFKSFQRGREQVVHGATHLLLDDAGRITAHRDYWDAAGELYEKLPLLGALMCWLRRRIAG